MPRLPKGTTHAFANLCGATVVITRTDRPAQAGWDRKWLCLGCDAGINGRASLDKARDEANEHAATCRALPKPEGP